ncbi:MAG TPA: DUF1990 family protein [Chloroflexota bacterium]|nr:DUF1990 family protein [Chloroflexota bacterium]
MRLVLTWRSPPSASCARWSSTPETSSAEGPANATVDHYEAAVVGRPGDSSWYAFDRARYRLLRYDIFPRRLIRYALCPPDTLREGATIVQRIVLGPVSVEMAVRVIDVWDREEGNVREVGFTYATLVGHAECGVATFRVRRDQDQGVRILIDVRSRPGTRLTHLARPVSRLFQRAITRAALRRLARS